MKKVTRLPPLKTLGMGFHVFDVEFERLEVYREIQERRNRKIEFIKLFSKTIENLPPRS